MRAVSLLSASAQLLLGAGACHIDGPWHYHDEQYVLAMDVKGATTGPLTARVVPGHAGGCTWCTAHGTLGADGSLEMRYDNGDTNKGTISSDCRSLSWGWKAGTGTGLPLEERPGADRQPCVPGHHHHGPPPPAPNPKKPNTDVKVVHVINSCHLDIGFADSSQGIVNRYFTHHIPYAAQVGAEMRALGRNKSGTSRPDKLNFMFQSWILNMYFDCPSGLGLACPNATEIATAEAAIKAGDITWHAFPHNAQLEIMAPALIEAGLQMSFDLDARFGLPKKQTISQRDVPGMTRSLIPILKGAGVTAISVGANDGSTPPNVPFNMTTGNGSVTSQIDWSHPMPFVWHDAASGNDILGMWNWPGYGSYPHNPAMVVPGVAHALVLNFNGDNAGPKSTAAYELLWAEISKEFPAAQIVASTFDNFTQHLTIPAVYEKLPQVHREIGDTWVYGVPSDPQKQARVRVINRGFGEAIEQLGGAQHLHKDPVLQNATRFALKLGEHTDGRDVKSNLKDNYSWRRADFQRAKAPGSKNASQYAILEESWWEQRQWGVTVAIDTLARSNHPLAQPLQTAVAGLQPKVPDLTGFSTAKAGTIYRCGGISVGFDKTGSISHLSKGGYSWASAGSTLVQLKYRSYSAKDVADFFATYCKSQASWVQHDYGKPGLPADVLGKIWGTTLKALWVQGGEGHQCNFVAQTAFEAEAVSEYGAAGAAYVQFNISAAQGTIGVDVGMFNKSTTRLPEAMFVQFQPHDSTGVWSVDKLGEWVSELDVVSGGSQHLQGVMEGGLRYHLRNISMATEILDWLRFTYGFESWHPYNASDGVHSLSIGSTDAGVANFGELTAYPSPDNVPGDTHTFGSSFVLWDNLWGTNYVEWWPFAVPPPAQFAASSKYFPTSWNNDMVSRYTLSLEG